MPTIILTCIHLCTCILCVLQDSEEAFRVQVFSLISNEAKHISALGGDAKSAVLKELSSLVELRSAGAVRAVAQVSVTRRCT
jgi:hypothetical protein